MSTPSVIGRYQIVERIGQGGMGALFLSWDPMLERQVAIKLLRDADNDDLRARFAREARSVASLRHPNIVTIFDVGEHDGRPFIAMEYIHGQTLGQMVQTGTPISLLRKLEIIAELCAGLGYAHKAGIVHRDIKPANLMVDSENVLKVLDFGIARLAQSGMTQAGMLIGTVNYMSPEQVTGQQVDARSDIFAVGAVSYELLTRRQAFAGGLHDVLNRVLHEQPTALEQLEPGLDPDIIQIVMRAMAKRAEDRYQDLATMRKDILRVHQRLETALSASLESDETTISERGPVSPRSARRTDPEELKRRRQQQIEDHLASAERAHAGGDFEAAIASCEEAMMLDPEDPRGLELSERCRHALDQRQAHQWLDEAQEHLRRGALSTALHLVEQALSLTPDSEPALDLRQVIDQRRVEREQERQRANALQTALDRAAGALAARDPDSAIRAADRALAIDPAADVARDIKAQATLRIEERARERAAEEERARERALAAARAVIADVDHAFQAGDRAEAFALLDQAAPHELIARAREEFTRQAREIAAREKAEGERKAREEAEAARIAREKAEQERIAREKAESARVAREKAEAERIAREKAEEERIARVKAEAERLRRAKAEAERKAREKAEAERIARETAEAERIAREQAEVERRRREEAARAAVAEQLARELAEAERNAREMAAERARREEAARVAAAEQKARQEAEAEQARKAEKERQAALQAENAERERRAAEKAEAERQAAEQAEKAARERRAAEEAERERRARELKDAERQAREKAAAERVAHEKAEADRKAREQAEAERLRREHAARVAAAEQQAREAERQRKSEEKAEKDRKAAAARQAREEADAERRREEAARVAAAAAQKKAREQADAERLRAERAEQERAALLGRDEAAPAAGEGALFIANQTQPLPQAAPVPASPGPWSGPKPAHYLAAAAVLAAVVIGGYYATRQSRGPDSAATAAVVVAPSPAAPAIPAPPQSPAAAPPQSTAAPSTEAPPPPPPPAASPIQNVDGEVAALRTRAQTQLSRGGTLEALATINAALKVQPDDPESRRLKADVLRDAKTRVAASRSRASAAGATESSANFKVARQRDSEAQRQEKSGQIDDAVRSLLAASGLYTKAADDAVARSPAPAATPAAPPATAEVKPSLPQVSPPPPAPAPAVPEPRAVPEPPRATPETRAPVDTRAADESAIRGALRAYEQAYRTLDVAAVQRVYPTVDAAGVKKAFDGLRAQDIQIRNEQIAIAGATATVTAQVSQSFTPRAGRSQTATFPAAVFQLQKSGGSWVIVSRK